MDKVYERIQQLQKKNFLEVPNGVHMHINKIKYTRDMPWIVQNLWLKI